MSRFHYLGAKEVAANISNRAALVANAAGEAQRSGDAAAQAALQEQLAALQVQQDLAQAEAAALAPPEEGFLSSHLPLVLGLLGLVAVVGIGAAVMKSKKSTAGYRRKRRSRR